jgi:hypothetical protein
MGKKENEKPRDTVTLNTYGTDTYECIQTRHFIYIKTRYSYNQIPDVYRNNRNTSRTFTDIQNRCIIHMQTGHFVYIFTSNLHAYSSEILHKCIQIRHLYTYRSEFNIFKVHIFGMHTDKIFHMDIDHVLHAQTDPTLYFAHTP